MPCAPYHRGLGSGDSRVDRLRTDQATLASASRSLTWEALFHRVELARSVGPHRTKGTQMPTIPRDYSDLFLAPVALNVEERLAELTTLDRNALHRRIAVDTDREAPDRETRTEDVVSSVTRLLDMHGWEAEWDERGIRLSSGGRSFVLGVPRNVAAYVDELQ